jgi:hypothetical protein
MKFENEPAWKQGEYCYYVQMTTQYSNPNYIKKFREMYILPVRTDITSFSQRNALGFDGGKVSQLTSSLLPITTPHFSHYLQVKQFIEQGGTITSITRIIHSKQE